MSLTFNYRTGVIAATTFSGAVTGEATGLSATLVETSGGTGTATYTTGDILYADAANSLAKLGAGASTFVLTANGAGVAPSWQAAAGGGGTVTSSGSPLNNEIAVFTTGTDIDSNANFTFDGTTVQFNSSTFGEFIIDRVSTTGGSAIRYQNDDGIKGYAGFNDLEEFEIYTNAAGSTGFTVTSGGNITATSQAAVGVTDYNSGGITTTGSFVVTTSTSDTAIDCNASSSVDFFFSGTLTGRAGGTGIGTYDIVEGDVAGDAGARILYFRDSGLVQKARIISSTDLTISNNVDAGHVIITADDTGGTARTILNGDPDAITTLTGDTQVVIEAQGNTGLAINVSGNAVLSNAGTERFETATFGTALLKSDGNTDAEARKLQYTFQNGTVRSELGYLADDVFYWSSLLHGGTLTFQGEDAGGTTRSLITADPDAGVVMAYAGTTRLQTVSAGVQVTGDVDIVLGSVFIDDDESITLGTGNDVDITFDGADLNISSPTATTINWTGGDNMRIGDASNTGTALLVLRNDQGAARFMLDNATGHARISQLASGLTIEDEWITFTRNGDVALFYNNTERFRSADHTAADMTSGAEITDSEGTFKPVGLGVTINDTTTFDTAATHTPFQQANASQVIYWVGTGASNWDTYASTGSSQTDIPAGTMWIVQSNGSGTLVIRGGSAVTIRYWAATGAPADADVTVARGGVATVRKVSDTIYDVWGQGLS